MLQKRSAVCYTNDIRGNKLTWMVSDISDKGSFQMTPIW
jgi:hypothetical protein